MDQWETETLFWPLMDLKEAKQRFPPIWTIYDHPRDYPEHFVVRVFYGLEKESQADTFDTLEDARRFVLQQGGSFNLHRKEEDDPVIAESWI